MQKYYTGNAAAVSLSAQLLSTQTSGTFAVSSAGGWPTPGPFVVAINRGDGNEEKLLCTRSGLNFTILERGYDGTGPQNHESGALVEHVLDAEIISEASEHFNVTPHFSDADHSAEHIFTPTSSTQPPTEYPEGITSFWTSQSGWPFVWNHVVTIRTPTTTAGAGFTKQICTNSANAASNNEPAISVVRYSNPGAGVTWSAWQPVTNEVLIATINPSTAVSNLGFVSIPQNFTHLKVRAKFKLGASSASNLVGTLNNTSGGYYSSGMYAVTTLNVASFVNQSTAYYGYPYWHTGSPNASVTAEIDFPYYSQTGEEKTFYSRMAARYTTSYNITSFMTGTASSITAPINRIDFSVGTTFGTPAEFKLFGVL